MIYEAPAGTRIGRALFDLHASPSSLDGTNGAYGAMDYFTILRAPQAGFLDECKAAPGRAALGAPSHHGFISRDTTAVFPSLNDTSLRIDVRCLHDSACNAIGEEPIGVDIKRTEIEEYPPLDGAPRSCSDVRPDAGTAYEFASQTPCPMNGTFSASV